MNNAIATTALLALLGGCTHLAPGPEEGEPTAAQQALAEDTAEAVQLVGAVAWELSQATEEPAASAGDEMPPPSEPGASCTRVEWNALDPLRLALHFTDCPLETGELMNGSVAVYLNHDGVRGAVGIDVTALTIGARSLEGFMVLSSDGGDVQIDCDVRYVDLDTDLRVALNGVNLRNDVDGVHLIGAGAITDAGLTYAADFNDVLFSDPTLCHPTAGSIDLSLPAQPPMTVLFAPTGVSVQVGSLPPFPLATAC